MKHWPTYLLCFCGLAMIAFAAFGPHCYEAGWCEPVSCEPCDAERCAALASLECEWAKGPSVALSYCKVER